MRASSLSAFAIFHRNRRWVCSSWMWEKAGGRLLSLGIKRRAFQAFAIVTRSRSPYKEVG